MQRPQPGRLVYNGQPPVTMDFRRAKCSTCKASSSRPASPGRCRLRYRPDPGTGHRCDRWPAGPEIRPPDHAHGTGAVDHDRSRCRLRAPAGAGRIGAQPRRVPAGTGPAGASPADRARESPHLSRPGCNPPGEGRPAAGQGRGGAWHAVLSGEERMRCPARPRSVTRRLPDPGI